MTIQKSILLELKKTVRWFLIGFLEREIIKRVLGGRRVGNATINNNNNGSGHRLHVPIALRV
jgi:hypothetical protein